MTKALFFKEWLKIKWSFWSMVALAALLLIKLALNISYSIRLMGANNFWYHNTVQGGIFYSDFVYFFAFAALVFAIAQYMPEIADDRLKLTLHLPMAENTILISMIFFGTMMFFVVYFLTAASLVGIVASHFPNEVVRSVCLTILPWGAAGLVVYWAAAAIFVERIWIKRIFLIIITALYVSNLLSANNFQIYDRVIVYFIFLSLLFSIAIIYTGHRYRKGVRK